MAAVSGAVFLSFVLFLGCWWGVEPYSTLVTKDSNKNSSLISKQLDKDLTQIFDEILQEAFPNTSNNGTGAPGGLTTWNSRNETHLQSNGLNNSELASSSNNQEEHLAKIVDEILQEAFPNTSNNGTGAPGGLTTWNSRNERAITSQNSPELQHFIGNMDKIPNSDHTSKRKRVKESFLFNRDVSQHLTTRVKGKLQGTDSPDAHLGSLPCGQLLHFLQKNIIVAAALVAAIIVVTVLLVLVLAAYIRGKRPLYPPANMTYNIFVMDGKSWWQKSQEKCLRKFAEKEKQLNCNSCV